MKDILTWMGQHPFLTAFLVLAALLALEMIIIPFKKKL